MKKQGGTDSHKTGTFRTETFGTETFGSKTIRKRAEERMQGWLSLLSRPGKEQHVLSFVMTALLLAGVLVGANKAAEYADNDAEAVSGSRSAIEERCTVVIDSGHGGRDSGKVSSDGILEKDLNLQIARLLKTELENEGITVIMTREDDNGLYQESDSNKKVADMRARLAVIEGAECDIAVSIHQNSYSDPVVSGAQVFYYTTSEKGKALAETIQNRLVTEIDPGNHRLAKANDSYFLLKETTVPLVIVECGFLSNPDEAQKLASAQYQEKLAHQIALAVIAYLSR